MNYIKVKGKDLKKHGKMVNGVLYIKEGVYCINTPVIDIELFNVNIKKNVSTKY